MSEQAEDIPVDISNEQVDKFFSGEDAGLPETTEVPQEATPEPVAEVKEPEEKPEPEVQKTVPLAALHEERQRRKELAENLRRIEEQNRLMEERFKMIQDRLKPQAPSFDEDPLAALKHQNDELARKAQEYEQRFSQFDQVQQQEAARQQFITRYQQEAQQFAQQAPDFNDAYKFLIQSRQAELASVGYNPQEISMLVQQEEAMLVGKAFEDGVNPGERVYAMAKARGYSKPEVKQEVKPEVKPDAEQKLDALQKGQQASASLSAVAGKGGDSVTLEMLATLSGDEFDKYWEKLVGPAR